VVALKLMAIVRLFVVLFAVATLTFFLSSLIPGDAALASLGPEATPEQIEAFREAEGLNDPILLRFVTWLGDLARGDLGQSIKYGESVSGLIAQRLPVTIQLALMAQVLALFVALPLAAFSAFRKGKSFDRVVSASSFVLLSMPNFIIGLALMYFLSIVLGWLPSSGYIPLSESFSENLKSMIMPTLAAAVGPIAVYTRVLRSDMALTLSENFILLARAQGIPPIRILFKYALRPSTLGLVTLVGINFGVLLGGAVVVEQLFALPGLGSLLVGAVTSRDFAVVQGITLLVAFIYVLVNFLVDRIYPLIDPRIRAGNAS
jgi:peptide/nickel transport system permease protein